MAVKNDGTKVWGEFDLALAAAASFAASDTFKLESDPAKSDSDFTIGGNLDMNGHTWEILGGTVTIGGSVLNGEGKLVISGGSFNFDPSTYLKNESYSAAKDEATGLWTVSSTVSHDWSVASAEVVGDSLTANCSCGEESATITFNVSGKTYDGQPIDAATIGGKDDFETMTKWTIGAVTYDGGKAAAPSAAGEHTASVVITDAAGTTIATFSKNFTIAKAAIDSLTFSPASHVFDGNEKSVTPVVKANGVQLTSDDYTLEGSIDGVKGVAYEDTSYTVTVTAKENGNFSGSQTASWKITKPTGEAIPEDKLSTIPGCSKAGTVVTVDNAEFEVPSKLAYDSATGKWTASLTITWPMETTDYKNYSTYGTAKFAKEDGSTIRVCLGDTVYTGAQILGNEASGLSATTASDGSYQYNSSYSGGKKTFSYFATLTYTVSFTVQDIKDGKLEYPITVWANSWTGGNNQSGPAIAATTYTLKIPSNIILNDMLGNQVHPEAEYIARNGDYLYLTLSHALEKAKAPELVEVYGETVAEGQLVVPVGVTLNLGSLGNPGTSYVLTGTELNNDAKVVSTKTESVTAQGVAENFFKVEENNFTYTLARNHEHLWGDFELNGNVLTAKCTNELNECTVPGAQLAVTLKVSTVSKEYDGSGFTATLSDTTDFEAFLTDGDKHTVNVGTVEIERPTYSTAKWYAGAYTAKCVITIDGEEYTLTQGVIITKPQNGYTDGFEATGIGGYDVRFDTLLEAAGAANEGDTIYYRGGDLTGKTVEFSAAKDITLDLGGASLKHDAYETVTLVNSGAGTVTLTNGKIVQPKSSGTWGSAGQMEIKGNFAFADIETKNRATSYANFFTITVKSGTVTVSGGQYTSQFKADGGAVVYQGGKFWDGKYGSTAHFSKPTPVMGPETGYIVIPGTGSMKDGNDDDRSFAWEVVAHTHDISYSAAENVITVTCVADNHEHCGYGSPTVTLTAENEKVSGQPYSSAHVAVTPGFPVEVTDADITYWQNDQKLESVPTETGDYVAKVTVEGATAVAEFQIFHEHEYKIEKTDEETLTATCKADGTCDAKTRTLKLVAKSRDWQKGTVFVASLEDGFGEAIAHTVSYVYKQGGETITAPKLTGEYTVEATVTVNETPYVLTKAFSITKPTNGYTAGYEVKGDEGEESKWLCYDTFADAVAAAEEKGTVVWHEGISGDKLEFSVAKDITIDCCDGTLSASYVEGKRIYVKNNGSGRATLTSLNIRQSGSHVVEVDGPVTFATGINCNSALKGLEGASLKIVGGVYNTDPSGFVDGKGDAFVVKAGWVSSAYTYTVVPHEHEFKTSASGNVLTVKCEGTDSDLCNFGKGATITLKAADALADGTTYAGASVDNQVTGDWAAKLPDAAAVSDADIVYYAAEDESTPLEGAPTGAGDYVVTLTYDGQTACATFSILPADISEGTFELNWATIAYDGQPHANAIKTAKIGETDIVLDRDFEVSGDDFTQTGSPAKDCTYMVTLTGIGNFKGTKKLSWTITAPTGEMGKLEEVKGEGQTAFAGELEGTTLTVTLTTNLCFLSGAWYAGLSVAVPNSIDGWSSDNSSGTNPDDLRIGFSHEDDLSQVAKDSHTWALSQKTITYAKSITWFAQFTLAEVVAAIEKGDTEIVRTMTVSAVPGTFNGAGIREVVYTIKLPLANLVLPVPAEKTLDAGDVEIDGFQLALGLSATVTANAQVADFATKLIPDSALGTDHYEVVENQVEGVYQYTLVAKEFKVNYYDVNDKTTPLHTDTATILNYTGLQIWNGDREGLVLVGYTKESGDPLEKSDAALHAYIADEAAAEGCDGVVKVFGTWEKPTITITIAKGTGVADVQTNGVSVVGELELPAETKTVELTLVKDTALVIPVYKVITNDVTNVTQRVATYAVVEGLTYTFIAEEAKADDPDVSDKDVADAIIDAIDPGPSHDDAVAKVEAVTGGDEPKVAPKELAAWITDRSIQSVDIAASDYLAASVKLDTPKPITEETEVKVETFENVSAEGFELSIAIKIDSEATPEVVKAAKEKIVGYIQAVDALGDEFGPVAASRVEIDTTTGKVTITPAEGKTSEFFKIVIPKDK